MNKRLLACIFLFFSLVICSTSLAKVDSPFCWELPGLKKVSTGGENSISVFFEEHLASKANEILEFAKRSDLELESFYGLKRTSEYRIYLASNRKHFETLTSKKRDWKKHWFVVGTALTENDSFILDPDKWDPRSHKFVNLDELVKHEMAHSFSLSLNGKSKGRNCFLKEKTGAGTVTFWFEEGLASTLAGQMETWKKRGRFEFEKYPHFEQILTKYGNYTTAGSAVEFLMMKFGQKKILEIISNFPANYYSKVTESNRVIFETLKLNSKQKRTLEEEWRIYATEKYINAK